MNLLERLLCTLFRALVNSNAFTVDIAREATITWESIKPVIVYHSTHSFENVFQEPSHLQLHLSSVASVRALLFGRRLQMLFKFCILALFSCSYDIKIVTICWMHFTRFCRPHQLCIAVRSTTRAVNIDCLHLKISHEIRMSRVKDYISVSKWKSPWPFVGRLIGILMVLTWIIKMFRLHTSQCCGTPPTCLLTRPAASFRSVFFSKGFWSPGARA